MGGWTVYVKPSPLPPAEAAVFGQGENDGNIRTRRRLLGRSANADSGSPGLRGGAAILSQQLASERRLAQARGHCAGHQPEAARRSALSWRQDCPANGVPERLYRWRGLVAALRHRVDRSGHCDGNAGPQAQQCHQAVFRRSAEPDLRPAALDPAGGGQARGAGRTGRSSSRRPAVSGEKDFDEQSGRRHLQLAAARRQRTEARRVQLVARTYHGSVHFEDNGKQVTVYYSANVFSQPLANGRENGIAVFDAPWKNVVATLYHEMNEFRTDPDVRDAIET